MALWKWPCLLPGSQVIGLGLARTKTPVMTASKWLTSEGIFPTHKYISKPQRKWKGCKGQCYPAPRLQMLLLQCRMNNRWTTWQENVARWAFLGSACASGSQSMCLGGEGKWAWGMVLYSVAGYWVGIFCLSQNWCLGSNYKDKKC